MSAAQRRPRPGVLERQPDRRQLHELEGPCSEVVQGHERVYSEKVRELFPTNKVLADLGAESYLGVPAVSSTGRVMGHLVVIDIKPIEKIHFGLQCSTFAAAPCGARARAGGGEARAALAEVEALKNQLEAENVYLQEEIRTEHRFDEIVGQSPALLAALHKVELSHPPTRRSSSSGRRDAARNCSQEPSTAAADGAHGLS